MTVRLAVLAALLLPPAAHAGLIIEGTEGGEASTTVLEGKRLRVEVAGSEGAMIWDGETRKIVYIEPREKQYSEITEGEAKAASAEAEKRLAQMPPELRARLEEQMGGSKKAAARPVVKWEMTGKSDAALGRRCDVYQQLLDGKLEGEACLIPFGALKMEPADLAALESFALYMAALSPVGVQSAGWTELTRAPGFPAITWKVEDGKRTEQFRATKVERTSVSADQFQVPAGFKKVPLR
jgi:hypothetical protein